MKYDRRLKRLEETLTIKEHDKPEYLTLIHRDGQHEKVMDTLDARVRVTRLLMDHHTAKYNNRPYPDTEIIGVIYPDGERIVFKDAAEREWSEEDNKRFLRELKEGL